MIYAPEVRYKPGVYLLHFMQPLGDPSRPRCSASHYCGFSKSVGYRLRQHDRSEGFGNIVHIANALGIQWIVAHIVYTDTVAEARALEKQWKRNGHHDNRCPICREAREQKRTNQL